MKKLVFFVALALLLSFSLVACKEADQITDDPENTTNLPEAIDIASLELSRYVELGAYSGLTVSYDSSQTSKGDAVWAMVVGNATIKEYPSKQVEYYFAQSKARYEYLAKKGGDSYENILLGLGVTEEMMLADARALVAEDLVLYALLEAESVTLSNDEKKANLEKYIDKFVEDYGYEEDYVRENMTEQIYDTMLFDKLLEKLVTLNEFSEN